MAEIISLKNVSKIYKGSWFRRFKALNDVSLNVEAGEAFGFVGPNGAGKSTTIKILTGIIVADSGEARISGIPVNNHLARKGIGYVPENPYLNDYLTPLEILLMGCHMHNLSDTNLKEHCMKVLTRFGIDHVANKRIRTFSKGMTQRTVLAHALACKPKLLILDEPLSGLDPIGRKEVVDILMEYRNNGGTIFFSSHVLNDVQRLGDRFGIIHKGEIRAVNTPAELIGEAESYFIIRTNGTMGIEGLIQDGPGKWHIQVNEYQLVEWLERLKNVDHKITDVQRGPTLEHAFLHYIKDSEKL